MKPAKKNTSTKKTNKKKQSNKQWLVMSPGSGTVGGSVEDWRSERRGAVETDGLCQEIETESIRLNVK